MSSIDCNDLIAEKQNSTDNNVLVLPNNHQIANQIILINDDFYKISDSISREHKIVSQLNNEFNNCKEVLASSEKALNYFQSESSIDCGYWLAKLDLLRESFGQFDFSPQIFIERLNRKMEVCFDEFIYLQNCLSLSTNPDYDEFQYKFNLIHNTAIAGNLALYDIVDYVIAQSNNQKAIVSEFTKNMTEISSSFEHSILYGEN